MVLSRVLLLMNSCESFQKEAIDSEENTPHRNIEVGNPTRPNPAEAIDSEKEITSHSRYLAVNLVLLHWSAALYLLLYYYSYSHYTQARNNLR